VAQLLSGKVAIVTGGSSGIGKATAQAFVAEGAKVVIADVNEDVGQALASDLGPSALFKRTDVSSADEVQAVVDTAVSHFGGLHIMFNNAGISSGRFPQFLDDELADFHKVMGINLFGVMVGSQRAGRHMAKNGGGVILNNASIAALMAGQALMTYRASKAAVVHFSKSIAIDLAKHNIRVNCLAPGHIRTPISSMAASPLSQETALRVERALAPIWDANKPLKRQGLPEDVAHAAVFLCSDHAAQITGIVMPIDGGISTGDPVNHLEALLQAQEKVLSER
jgi:NAD(P)-dependent dehydrogenase (short-subunit alcohol dehydrogenase family)